MARLTCWAALRLRLVRSFCLRSVSYHMPKHVMHQERHTDNVCVCVCVGSYRPWIVAGTEDLTRLSHVLYTCVARLIDFRDMTYSYVAGEGGAGASSQGPPTLAYGSRHPQSAPNVRKGRLARVSQGKNRCAC